MDAIIEKWAGQIPSASLEYAIQKAAEELGRKLTIAERERLESADAADKAGRMAKLVIEGLGWDEAIQLYGVYAKKFPSLPSGGEIEEAATPTWGYTRQRVEFLYTASIKIAKSLLRRAYGQWPGWFSLTPNGFSAIPHTWGRGDRTFAYDALFKRVTIDYSKRPTNLHAYDLMAWVDESVSTFEVTWGDGKVEAYEDTEAAQGSERISFILKEVWAAQSEAAYRRVQESRIEGLEDHAE